MLVTPDTPVPNRLVWSGDSQKERGRDTAARCTVFGLLTSVASSAAMEEPLVTDKREECVLSDSTDDRAGSYEDCSRGRLLGGRLLAKVGYMSSKLNGL